MRANNSIEIIFAFLFIYFLLVRSHSKHSYLNVLLALYKSINFKVNFIFQKECNAQRKNKSAVATGRSKNFYYSSFKVSLSLFVRLELLCMKVSNVRGSTWCIIRNRMITIKEIEETEFPCVRYCVGYFFVLLKVILCFVIAVTILQF